MSSLHLDPEVIQLLVFVAVLFGVLAIGGVVTDYLEAKNAKRNYRQRTGRFSRR